MYLRTTFLVLEEIGKVVKKNMSFGTRKNFITREPEILFLEYKTTCGYTFRETRG